MGRPGRSSRDGVVVRIAAPDDGPAVGRLLEASYPVLMADGYEPDAFRAAVPLLTRPNPALLAGGTFFVAEAAGGEIVGCGGWTPEPPGGGEVVSGTGHVRHFAVHPEYARHGIGRRLYRACVRQARAADISCLQCFASLSSEDFYTALGFETLGGIEIPISDALSLPAVRMARQIR